MSPTEEDDTERGRPSNSNNENIQTNALIQDFSLFDPGLTRKGRQECNDLAKFLREKVPLIQDAGLIVTSPLRRTLETTDIALGWLARERGVPVMLKAEWQETTDKPCDTGVPIAQAKTEWPQYDFGPVFADGVYPEKEGPYVYTQDALVARIGGCLKWLQHRPEKVVVVVSHSGFMRRLSGRKFGNADFRVFEFSRDNEFVERRHDGGDREGGNGGRMMAHACGGRGLSPSSPSRAKEHWAGIKKSSSNTDLKKGPNGEKLDVPCVPLRPSSR